MARRAGSLTLAKGRKPRARDRAWQSMRILRRFTIVDLIATAEIGLANMRVYLIWLERRGYVRKEIAARSGEKGGHAVYRLLRDTGPEAPRLNTEVGYMHDINGGAQ